MSIDGQPGRLARVASTAETARLRLINDVSTALATAVRGLRTPALLLALAPMPLAVILAILSVMLGGSGGRTGIAIAVVALVPSLWLLRRRRRMMRAVDPPQALADEIGKAFDIAGAWSQAEEILAKVRSSGRGFRGAMGAVRGVWAGLKLGQDILERIANLPRVEPLMPMRLQTTVYLGGACVVSFVALLVLDIVAFVLVMFAVLA